MRPSPTTTPTWRGTVWENRRNLPYAWRILRKGVCDGCALGVAGFHDWTISGVHLCTTRLSLLKVNTMGALDVDVLADVEELRRRSGKELRDLGRLPYPMVRRRGERGFRRVSWDDALDLIADRIRATDAATGSRSTSRRAASPTSRTTSPRRPCGSSGAPTSTTPPGSATRRRRSRSSSSSASGPRPSRTRDVIGTDLVVLFGSNVANAQPVFMKYLYLARKRGAKVVVVNPLREPGLDRYWVPSNVESAMFGTKMADEFFAVHTGGDVAFLNGVLKALLEQGGTDDTFVREHTTGFDARRRRARRRWTGPTSNAQSGASARRHGALRPAVRRRSRRRSSCGRWGSRSTSTAPTTSPPS